MKRRVFTALAVALAGLMLSAGGAAARDGYGDSESNDWNFPLTNIGLL
ncbi:hypothetical protein ACF073_22925 [Streptomyces sp. NPDC015171]